MSDQPNLFEIAQQVGDITTSRLEPEVLEEARQQRIREAERRAANPAPLPVTGHNLWVTVSSATIDGDEIHVGVVVHGQVQRPEALATAHGVVRTVKVPASVDRRVHLPEPAFAIGDPVEVLGSAPRRETRGLLGEITRGEGASGEWAYEVMFGPEGRSEGASWVVPERHLRRLTPEELAHRRVRR